MKCTFAFCLLLFAIITAPASAQFATSVIQNCSFESGLSGWTVAAGLATVSGTPDALLPSNGSNYLILNPNGTGNASPGYGPHPPGGTLPGVAQIYQYFTMPSGARSLTVSWEFVNIEGINAFYNDFVSIDLLDAGFQGRSAGRDSREFLF